MSGSFTTLTVSGGSTLAGGASVSGGASVANTLVVQSGSLATLTSVPVNFNGGLTVAGGASAFQNVTLFGNYTLTADYITLGKTLTATAGTLSAQAVAIAGASGITALSVGSAGTTSIANSTTLSGATTLSGTTTLSGVVAFTSATAVTMKDITSTGTIATTGTAGLFSGPAAKLVGNPSILVTPSNASGYSTLLVQGITNKNLQNEYLASFVLNSRNDSGGNKLKVGLYAENSVSQSGTTLSGDAWSVNSLLYIAPSVIESALPSDWVGTGYELDVNNASTINFGASGNNTPALVGLNITAGGVHTSTAAIHIHGNDPGTAQSNLWNFGIVFLGGSVAQITQLDATDSSWSYEMQGHHYWGIDMAYATIYNSAIRLADGQVISALQGTTDIQLLTYKANVGPGGTITPTGALILAPGTNSVGNGGVQVGAHFMPKRSATYDLGAPNLRFRDLYYTGTVNPSSPALKTDIMPLPPMLPLVREIEPRSFRWKSEVTTAMVSQTETIEIVEEITEEVSHIEVRNGIATRVTRSASRPVMIFDEVPVFDENGQPIIVELPGKPAVFNDDGAILSPAIPTSTQQLTHRIPRVKEISVMREVNQEQPGSKTNIGFMAPDFKQAFDGLGIDFAGYVNDGGGNEGLRIEQQIGILWKAVQELADLVDQLRIKAG